VVVDEIDHMTALVERLLLLGRVLEPDFAVAQPVDLRSFMADLHESAIVLAPRTWQLRPVPDLTLHASLERLRGALLNLIENAVNATADGARIDLEAVRRGDGWLELAVADSGPGIPEALRHDVLDRFRRPGAADSNGSGLGLAIVRAVAEAHGGEVRISQADLGGARVAVALPPAVVTTSDLR
jgi:signal transduction histidine kinase